MTTRRSLICGVLICFVLSLIGCTPPFLPDWETFQGNAGHTGYVPARLNPENFVKIWEWKSPNSETGVTPFINPAVAADGVVYVTDDDYFSDQQLYALDETDGSVIWTFDFGEVAALNQPAVNGSTIYVATSGHGDTFMWGIDAASGDVLFKTPFDTQWPHYLSPTVLDGVVYNNTGYFGGRIMAFSAVDGVKQWENAAYGDNDMFTPAVDENAVYHYSGTALYVLDKSNGALLATIPDPDPDTSGYSHIGSTVIGSMNNILSFSGDNYSGRASSSTEGYYERRLVSFDLLTESVAWKSDCAYLSHPALSKGKVFAGCNDPIRLEALSEQDGSVKWTWTQPEGEVEAFHRNIIVTMNLVFVSGDQAVYAISRFTHKQVWSYPEPGTLSLSPSGILYIAVGARMSDGRLVAIDLY